jgi:hypothetical protein
MCPICWATLLASYAGCVSAALAAAVARDRGSLCLAAAWGLLWGARQSGLVEIPTIAIAAAAAGLGARVASILARRSRLALLRGWQRSTELAAARCPRKT